MTALDWTVLADLVAPLRCAACDERVCDHALFCDACVLTVEPSPTPDAAFVYGGALAHAIVRMKYGGRSDLASRLGVEMARSTWAALLTSRIDLVVPVPMFPLRVAERGFNHAALLARPLAKALAVPVATRALERVRDTPRQAAL